MRIIAPTYARCPASRNPCARSSSSGRRGMRGQCIRVSMAIGCPVMIPNSISVMWCISWCSAAARILPYLIATVGARMQQNWRETKLLRLARSPFSWPILSEPLIWRRQHSGRSRSTKIPARLPMAQQVVIAWEEDGIWFRSVIDWLHDDLRTVDDFKSTGMSVAPHVLGIRAEAAGWDIQAAFIERGLDVLDPVGAGRRQFRFIAQETDEPHALSVMHMDERWLTMGRKKVQHAVDRWSSCIRNGTRQSSWPGYPNRSITPNYPGYKENQWLQREMAEAIENDPSLIMAG